MVIQDDRTPEQQTTHTTIVVGTDSFMSGWGQARNGASYAGWACEPKDAADVLLWVESRKEMKRVRVVSGDYRPNARNCAHFHIYVVESGHRALNPNRGE